MNEHMAIDPEVFSYEKYIWDLLTEAHLHHIQAEIIGQESSRHTGMIYPLYRLVVNPEAQETVCMVSGVHGNEIAGPLSILSLLKGFHGKIPSEFRYVIYPVINPTGFDLRQRYDADGRDLNAVYKDTLTSKNYAEVQAFHKDVQQFSPFEAVLTLHEDSDLELFYMYGLGEENLSFYHALCAFAKTLCPTWANADIYGCASDDFGLVLAKARDHAFDAALFTNKSTRVALTFETPGKRDIHFRVNMMIHMVLMCLHMLTAMKWMTPFCETHHNGENIKPY